MKEDLETVIDRLYDYVRTKGSVGLNETAKALALNPLQVEKLALLLEDSNLMEVRYTLSGVTLVEKAFLTEKEAKEKMTGVKQRANKIFEETRAMEREVMTSENLLEFIEKDIMRRMKAAEMMLQDIEKTDSYSASELNFVRNEIDLVIRQLDAFGAEIQRLESRETGLRTQVDEFRRRLEKLHATRAEEVVAPSAGRADAFKRAISFLNRLFSPQAMDIISGKPESPAEQPMPQAKQPAAQSQKQQSPKPQTFTLSLGAAKQQPAAAQPLLLSRGKKEVPDMAMTKPEKKGFIIMEQKKPSFFDALFGTKEQATKEQVLVLKKAVKPEPKQQEHRHAAPKKKRR
ncbi:Uncharacterised protein [Candidatus Norongarragalina meridionalis]|nr:Uncharacterised protein [Candidatus Norongarragalina meridionalis]